MRGRRLVVALVLVASMCAASLAAEPYGPQSFAGNTGWLNSPPIDAHSLRGSIVLVDFWEYTCVNCLRTLPYLREWYKRYAKYGFTIVGVHTPEFDFSAQPANVQAAVHSLDIEWPVVMDANLAIWNQYRNDGWPHEYLYDRSGRLVESIFGEGRYQEPNARSNGYWKPAACTGFRRSFRCYRKIAIPNRAPYAIRRRPN